MKRIAVLTGTRAEYGILRELMTKIRANRSGMQLQLLVTGAHISKEFGYTIDQIIRDGFKINSRVMIMSKDDSGLGMALSLGKAISGIAKSLAKLDPHILVVLGDRLEVLAAALAATYLGIPIAHIHGGDQSGSVDQPVRYAVSKLSHLHLVATSSAAIRLQQVGEEPRRIFVVGAPGIDEIVEKEYTNPSDLAKKYKLDPQKPLLILLQHPVVTEVDKAASQIEQTLEAVEDVGVQSLVIHPNADAGGRAMIRVIKGHCRQSKFLRSVASIPRSDFLGLMSIADVMVGNSSSGIIEAPSFGLPVVNIGTRQAGRERGSNTIDVTHSTNEIKEAIRKALSNESFIRKARGSQNPYGDGRSSEKIVNILDKMNLDEFWPKA